MSTIWYDATLYVRRPGSPGVPDNRVQVDARVTVKLEGHSAPRLSPTGVGAEVERHRCNHEQETPIMRKNKNLAEFLAAYDPDGTRVLADIIPVRDADGNSPFVIVRHGRFAAVLALMPFDDHLCIDVFPFTDGEDATAGVFGMTEGRQHTLPDTGTTSHGWPSMRLISVLIGKQAKTSPARTCGPHAVDNRNQAWCGGTPVPASHLAD